VLSIHLDGRPCRVGCPFCYLGARIEGDRALLRGSAPPGSMPDPDPVALVEAALDRVDYAEVAIALSEPITPARLLLERLVAAAARRSRPVAVTTTLDIAAAMPALARGVSRVSLSVDPAKGRVAVSRVVEVARALKAEAPALEVVLIVSLATPEFATRLFGGLLEELVDLPAVDRVALNALKPPPPWCDRGFWLEALARLRPLLERALDRRLFLDCYVAARLLRLGGCPGRADLTTGRGGVEVRSCVYQAAPDFFAVDADQLVRRTAAIRPPEVCPFDTRFD
jgi:hypothetical protein